MTLFEKELKRILDHNVGITGARYIGNICYGKVSDDIRAKIYFVCNDVADKYDSLRVTLLNRREGQIDSVNIGFRDLWGMKKTNNPNFKEGISPYIWGYGNHGWYVYYPTNEDYFQLAKAVDSYLELFREPVQGQMEQKMF